MNSPETGRVEAGKIGIHSSKRLQGSLIHAQNAVDQKSRNTKTGAEDLDVCQLNSVRPHAGRFDIQTHTLA